MENRKNLKWIILITICCGTFMANLDTSIVNLAISKMMQTYNSSIDQIQWVLSAYTLSMGIVVPISGYMCDRFGIKRVFIAALMFFTVGSFLCGTAWNTASIIGFRIIQGIGGGLIIPVSMNLIMDTFVTSDRSTAIGILGVATMSAPAIGPTLGGYIIQNLDWRLVFFINIPIGILGSIMAFVFFEEGIKKEKLYFDFIGIITSSIGLSCILYVFGNENTDWNDIKSILLVITGIYCLAMFVANELMIPHPMLELRLLKNYAFCMGNIIMNVSLIALFGGIFLIPVFLQRLKGLDAMQTGLILFPEAIATAFSMVVSSKLSDKYEGRIFAVLALLLIGINSFSMSKITLDTPNSTITFLLMIRGLGVGCLLAPVQIVALNSIPKEMNSNASAILNTIKQIGSALGVTIVTRIMQNRSAAEYADTAQKVTMFNHGVSKAMNTLSGAFIKNGLDQLHAKGASLMKIYQYTVRQTGVQGLNDTMFVISIICFVMIIPALFLNDRKAE